MALGFSKIKKKNSCKQIIHRKKIFDRVTKQTKVREKVIDFCEVVTDTFLITENYFL